MNESAAQELLMAYLYNELEGEQQAQFEAQLKQNPSLQRELQQLQGTQQLLGTWKDQPVTAPVLLLPHHTPEPGPASSFWQQGWTRAAAVALLMVGSSLLTALWMQSPTNAASDLQSPNQAFVTQEQFQRQQNQLRNWLQQSLFRQQDSLYHMMGNMNTTMKEEITKLRRNQPSSPIQPAFVELNDRQFQELRTEIIDENYQMLTDLLHESHQYQQDYTKSLLRDFASYMDEQRTEDLQRISYGLNYLKEHGDQRQQETELLLTQLVANIQAGSD